MTTRLPALCDSCIHKGPQMGLEPKFPCNAFPSGVPSDILGLEFDHRNPHPLDNGIVYEMDPDQQPLLDLHLAIRDELNLEISSE